MTQKETQASVNTDSNTVAENICINALKRKSPYELCVIADDLGVKSIARAVKPGLTMFMYLLVKSKNLN